MLFKGDGVPMRYPSNDTFNNIMCLFVKPNVRGVRLLKSSPFEKKSREIIILNEHSGGSHTQKNHPPPFDFESRRTVEKPITLHLQPRKTIEGV